MSTQEEVLFACRWAFTYPFAWRAANELIRRGYYVKDRKRHFLWEWVAITKEGKVK